MHYIYMCVCIFIWFLLVSMFAEMIKMVQLYYANIILEGACVVVVLVLV